MELWNNWNWKISHLWITAIIISLRLAQSGVGTEWSSDFLQSLAAGRDDSGRYSGTGSGCVSFAGVKIYQITFFQEPRIQTCGLLSLKNMKLKLDRCPYRAVGQVRQWGHSPPLPHSPHTRSPLQNLHHQIHHQYLHLLEYEQYIWESWWEEWYDEFV